MAAERAGHMPHRPWFSGRRGSESSQASPAQKPQEIAPNLPIARATEAPSVNPQDTIRAGYVDDTTLNGVVVRINHVEPVSLNDALVTPMKPVILLDMSATREATQPAPGTRTIDRTATTVPAPAREFKRRDILKGIAALGTATLAGGGLFALFTRGSDTSPAKPTAVPAVGSGDTGGGFGPAATATEGPQAAVAVPSTATKGPEVTVTTAPAAPTDVPKSPAPATGTPEVQKTPTTLVTPEVKRDFSVKVNIIRPGNKQYEDVFGPVQEVPIEDVLLNEKFVHPSGLTAKQMQKRVNDYGQAAGRYADEWYVEQLRTTGKQPQGRPPDVSPEHPTIKKYMTENKPYQALVWGGDRMFDLYKLTGEETIDPTLGSIVNIVPITAEIIEKMRRQSMPASVEGVYRTGVNNGQITYDAFVTPRFLATSPGRINSVIAAMMNQRQNPILYRGIRESMTPPNFVDPNLIDMYYSTIATGTEVPNTMKVDAPPETPLYVVKYK